MHKAIFSLILTFSFSLLAAPALAGPPLICHPIAIGNAPSLPWNAEAAWNGMVAGYDTSRLAADTLAIVVSEAPVTVRMETLRRAAIYSSRDPRQADEIASRLFAQKAWFDVGFFIEAVKETGEAYAMARGPEERAAWRLRTPPPYVAALLSERR